MSFYWFKEMTIESQLSITHAVYKRMWQYIEPALPQGCLQLLLVESENYRIIYYYTINIQIITISYIRSIISTHFSFIQHKSGTLVVCPYLLNTKEPEFYYKRFKRLAYNKIPYTVMEILFPSQVHHNTTITMSSLTTTRTCVV